MTISDAQFAAWLKNPDASRVVLVEATVGLNGGGTTTRYLSNKGYTSSPSDTPANTYYQPRITGNLQITRSIDVSNNGALSQTFGDLALNNIDGALDSWFNDYWVNRSVNYFVGDPTWARSDFRQVFAGVCGGIDTSDRVTFNVLISDKLQRLNTTVSETTLGGSTALADNLLPLTFGECFNITPLLTDGTVNEYQVHNGAVESIIEVRDNGVPVAFTSYASTGKFRLNNQPYGTVTCSVQGAKIPANLVVSTNTFAGWTYQNATISSSGAGPSPGITSYAAVADTTSGSHYIFGSGTVTAGAITTSSVYVKQGAGSKTELQQQAGVVVHSVFLDFTTGLVSSSSNGGGAVINSYGAVPVGNGWWRVWITSAPDTTSTTRYIVVVTYNSTGSFNYVGDNSTAMLYVAGGQLETGSYPTSFVVGSPLNTPVYRNSAASLVQYITGSYGSVVNNRFSLTDINIASFVQFDAVHRQPVGIYLSDRENVLDVCNQLLQSLGSQLYIDSSGLVSIVQLSLPQSLPGTSVGISDMQDRTLAITTLPPVVAGIKLGYNKNWTVQTTTAGGLDQRSAALFAQEWLMITQKDTAAAANYNLYTDPDQIDTMLQVGSDATSECTRRLNIFNVQRKVLQYTGFFHLIQEQLGSPQTITHPRFGLSGGVTGQIVSVAVDYLANSVVIQVLI